MGRVPAVRSLLENSRFSVNESCDNAKSVLFVPLSKSFVSPVMRGGHEALPRMPEVRTSCAEISSSFFIRAKRQPATPRKRRRCYAGCDEVE
jgi:hypothetical protein